MYKQRPVERNSKGVAPTFAWNTSDKQVLVEIQKEKTVLKEILVCVLKQKKRIM